MVSAPTGLMRKETVEEEKSDFVNGKYIIPFSGPKPTKRRKKSKKMTKTATEPRTGIKIVKNREALTVKMPEYDDSIYKNKGRVIKKEDSGVINGKKTKKAKKAPINVGCSNIV